MEGLWKEANHWLLQADRNPSTERDDSIKQLADTTYYLSNLTT